MPELNDISLHQLIAQWEKDYKYRYKTYTDAKEKYSGECSDYLEGNLDELESCITELKQVIGLLP